MSRGETPLSWDDIVEIILAEVKSEIEFRGIIGYHIDKKRGKVTFERPQNREQVIAILQASENCIINGLSVTIK